MFVWRGVSVNEFVSERTTYVNSFNKRRFFSNHGIVVKFFNMLQKTFGLFLKHYLDFSDEKFGFFRELLSNDSHRRVDASLFWSLIF